jgi:integrase
MRDQIPLLDFKHGTLKRYNVMLHRLEEYGKFRQWSDITIEGIYEWNAWLRERRIRPTAAEQAQKQKPQRISTSAVYNYHKCFKAMLNRAVKFGIIPANPYDRIRGEFKRGDVETVEYLTEAQMKAIEQLPVLAGSLMERCKDVFVFQMYTGLAYSDAMAFDIRNYRNEDGMWTAVAERVKTGVAYISRLLPPAVAVLEKYDMKVPYIENQIYNRTLKAIGIAAGISFPLHSHIARHTFATYMLNNKISLDSVSVMLGHTNTVQTRRYAKTLAQTVRDDFDKVAEKLKKTPPSQAESQK